MQPIVLRLETQGGAVELELHIKGLLEETLSPRCPGDDSWEQQLQDQGKRRATLTTILRAVAQDKPDKLEPFAVEWLERRFGKSAERSLSPWTSRTDLYPSEAAFATYFLEIRLPTLLEKAIELAPETLGESLLEFFLSEGRDADARRERLWPSKAHPQVESAGAPPLVAAECVVTIEQPTEGEDASGGIKVSIVTPGQQ
ncbi:hypothetical protein EMIHUDRAFT_198811 [Emiliania huxleyi CCMP1516]|uniref:Uncharacterized protein n=2 Tax=Emiliania huxleyi TaxID=2903 RepID=A0A0D3I1T3_EMIH1|nr:hypothetical protein EMIHUDRAFT_198811 [Emiliania huxleyi CCMP1516]EOD05218.1 hypothetical protein EMIHUDRAFT_198811 [Emiliania huxleyi CCMP1516]|eukprot:XP_005757647.1 hypothetical protein EMIHUDRAFT_198811 [Emiliania huxleyi CCMP1516]